MYLNTQYDAIISGMGCAGLACAYEAAKQNLNVLIITNRSDDFTRVQRIMLSKASQSYLKSMLSDDATYSLSTASKKYLMSVLSKDAAYALPTGRDEYLYYVSMLNENDTPTINYIISNIINSEYIALKDLDRLLICILAQFETIRMKFRSALYSIDLDEGRVQIERLDIKTRETKPSYGFKYLIGADGVGHHGRNILSKKNNAITYIVDQDTTDNKDLGSQHMSAYLLIRRTCGGSIEFAEDEDLFFSKDESVFLLDRVGYNKPKHFKTQIKCNFTGEMPQYIRDISDKSCQQIAALKYMRAFIREELSKIELNCKVKELDISFVNYTKPDNKKRVFATFERPLHQASQAGLTKNGHYFFLAGDSNRSPNYKIGHGANDALSHAQLLGEFISSDIALNDYNEQCDRIGFHAELRTKLYSTHLSADKFSNWLQPHLSEPDRLPDELLAKIVKWGQCNELLLYQILAHSNSGAKTWKAIAKNEVSSPVLLADLREKVAKHDRKDDSHAILRKIKKRLRSLSFFDQKTNRQDIAATELNALVPRLVNTLP